MFLYYANEESSHVVSGTIKTVQHLIKNISLQILKQCSLNLVPELFITKESK